jgi:5'-deoxynucleotidase YfbR-like HD superfamily hydrolase
MNTSAENAGSLELLPGHHNPTDIAFKAITVYLDRDRTDNRYAQHNPNVQATIHAHGYTGRAMDTGVAFHDVVDGLFTDEELVVIETEQYLMGVSDAMNVGTDPAVLAGIGLALSGHEFEAQTAESWREPATERVDALEGYSDREKDMLKGAINKKVPAGVDRAELTGLLRRTPLFNLEIGSLGDAAEKHDIESVICKAAELVDNLRHRPEDNPASTWRDCIEALSCYAPLLVLSGNPSLAAELSGLAYEFFYEEDASVRSKGKNQLALSEEYKDDILSLSKAAIGSIIPENNMAVPIKSRLKSLGSYYKKFNTSKYKNKRQIPDGVASRATIINNLASPEYFDQIASEITAAFQEMSNDEFQIEEVLVKNYMQESKENGYKALHLNYKLIPFEIQINDPEMEDEDLYGKSSHVLYKLNTLEPSKDDIVQLRKMRQRAINLEFKPNTTSLSPYSWIEILKRFPNMDTPLQQIYAVNSEGMMVPKALKNVPMLQDGRPQENVILPAHAVTLEQFNYLITLLDDSLLAGDNPRITRAINIITEAHGSERRKDQATSVLEGHLLPVALHAALLSSISGRRWEDTENNGLDLESTIVAALLHDYVEDTVEDPVQGIAFIRDEFGDDIANIVAALTSPNEEEIPDQETRRAEATRQLVEDPRAAYIKVSDRSQNHVSDLVNWYQAGRGANPELILRMDKYFTKSDKHVRRHLESLPNNAYVNVISDTWLMRRSIAYALLDE